MPLVRLIPATLQSQVKHSTTEPPHFSFVESIQGQNCLQKLSVYLQKVISLLAKVISLFAKVISLLVISLFAKVISLFTKVIRRQQAVTGKQRIEIK